MQISNSQKHQSRKTTRTILFILSFLVITTLGYYLYINSDLSPRKNKASLNLDLVESRNIGKVFGISKAGWDDLGGLTVFNTPEQALSLETFPYIAHLTGVGAINSTFYYLLGNSSFTKDPAFLPNANFFVATSGDDSPSNGIEINDFLNRDSIGNIGSALKSRPKQVLPNSLFSLRFGDQTYLFSHYADIVSTRGNTFDINFSGIAKFEKSDNFFHPYKSEIYLWDANDFALADLWQEPNGEYIYILGTGPNRMGGLKLGRIKTIDFLDEINANTWEYYAGNDNWKTESRKGVWIIPPRNPEWSSEMDWSKLSYSNQCQWATIGEISVVRVEFLNKFALFTSNGCPGNEATPEGIWIYTADKLTGPWEGKLLIPNKITDYGRWTYLSPQTDEVFVENAKQTIYLFATVPEGSGVYLFEVNFARSCVEGRCQKISLQVASPKVSPRAIGCADLESITAREDFVNMIKRFYLLSCQANESECQRLDFTNDKRIDIDDLAGYKRLAETCSK